MKPCDKFIEFSITSALTAQTRTNGRERKVKKIKARFTMYEVSLLNHIRYENAQLPPPTCAQFLFMVSENICYNL